MAMPPVRPSVHQQTSKQRPGRRAKHDPVARKVLHQSSWRWLIFGLATLAFAMSRWMFDGVDLGLNLATIGLVLATTSGFGPIEAFIAKSITVTPNEIVFRKWNKTTVIPTHTFVRIHAPVYKKGPKVQHLDGEFAAPWYHDQLEAKIRDAIKEMPEPKPWELGER